jgi:molybdenum cofactor guanylyltransferase
MRRDKATADLAGVTMAERVARALRTVAHPILAVGPDAGTGFESVRDPREGPLKAIGAGADALRERGWDGPTLVLACDMPFVTADLLAAIVRGLGEYDAVVPMLRGREQPLAACYSASALALARWTVADGGDALHDLLRVLNVRKLQEEEWTEVAPIHSLVDVDTPGALLRARMILRSPQ